MNLRMLPMKKWEKRKKATKLGQVTKVRYIFAVTRRSNRSSNLWSALFKSKRLTETGVLRVTAATNQIHVHTCQPKQ